MKNKFAKGCLLLILISLSGMLFSQVSISKKEKKNYLNFDTAESLHEFFRYKGKDDKILVSAHRGGMLKHFPENGLEAFANLVNQMPLIFEIDPRLTKDSVIVLMHDATLDRTTNATGKLSDYTWAELQNVRLKDSFGNVTDQKIPLLEDIIKWSRGKTIINLDKKDVPFDMVVDIIKRNKAENHVMLTVHTGSQARYYYDRLPGIMMSAFMRNNNEFEDMKISGVPWDNMIAYVGWTIDSKNEHIVKQLHRNGVKCMISVAPSHDKLVTLEERKIKYQEEIEIKPDIIESDIPTEVWSLVK